MKNFFQALLPSLMLWAAVAGPATAQTRLSGKWQGSLEVAPGKRMTVQFEFKEAPGGGFTAVMNSPDEGAIKNVSAKSVTFADNKLNIDVPDLSGSYAGTLRNGAFEGEWSQEGAKLSLTLKPWETPTITKADIDALRGDWSGQFKGMGLEVTIVLRFTTGADGKLIGVLDVPEQSVSGWLGSDIRLDDGQFHFWQDRAQVAIKGELKGGQIVGHWNQMGNSVPLTLNKGKYVAPTNYLDFPAAARDQLKGRWTGKLNGSSVAVRFETDAQGRTTGSLQNVDVGASLPITTGKFEGTKLTFTMAGVGGKYTGELANGKLTGEWMQLGLQKPLPLELTREK
jgi:hypothetical protein